MLATIQSYGVASNKDKTAFHIFCIGWNGTKVFFTEEGTWTEDINERAESEDFKFVYEEFCNISKDDKIMQDLESSLFF